MSEIELILTKLKIVSEEKENGMYLCDKKHSKILLDYIQQKENIIKEVREYNEEILKENWYGGNEKEYAKHNLKILEKGDKGE
jgi:hypothetical protein